MTEVLGLDSTIDLIIDENTYPYEEGFYQNVSLEAGKTYTISFEQANFGATSNSTQYYK